MSDIPDGLNTVLNGLEQMAESATGYRELLTVLEVTIELNSWFTNYGKPIHERCNEIENTVIPQITTEPRDVDKPTYSVAQDIQAQHGHFSIYAAETAAEYWQNQ
jgi:hypothetical protein